MMVKAENIIMKERISLVAQKDSLSKVSNEIRVKFDEHSESDFLAPCLKRRQNRVNKGNFWRCQQ